MKNPKTRTKVVHSQTKSAWNVIGETLGGKHKIARVPYISVNDETITDRNRNEAFEHAEFISHCFNHSDGICKQAEHSQPKISDEIVEQIQAFKDADNRICTHERTAGIVSKRSWCDYHLNVVEPRSSIHRVKTNALEVEDTVQDGRIIKQFFIRPNGVLCAEFKNGGYELVKHLRKPTLSDVTPPVIFTTHDNVDVRDPKQKVYGTTVDVTDYSGVGTYPAEEAAKWHGDGTNIAFSTREAANEYIRLNKVRHSDKDVMQLVEKTIDKMDSKWFAAHFHKSDLLTVLQTELNNKTND